MLLTRFGVQEFGKSQDDIIKYSADLLDTSHKWRTRKMKEIVKQLDQTQYVFTKEQQELLDAGVTPAEVIQLTTLFLQKKIEMNKLESNLRLLVQKCGLHLASEVTIDDLERVVMGESTSLESESGGDDMDPEPSEGTSQGGEKNVSGPLVWPPSIGDHVTVNFDAGFKIGEILELDKADNVRVNFMHPKAVDKCKPKQFWVWGYGHKRWVDKEFILPIHPVLELEVKVSSTKLLIFRLENLDVIEGFAE